MFCNDSSNVIRQCNNICVYYLTFVRISHKKEHQKQTCKHKYLGAALLQIIQIFTHNQKAIPHFFQHPSENFVYFDAAHSEFSSNNIVTYELTEISDPCFLIYRFLKDISGIFMAKINTKLLKIMLKLGQNQLIFCLA